MMTSRARNLWPSRLALLGALVLVPTVVLAAGRPGKVPKPWQFNPDHETVELFNAIDSGKLSAKLIPKDSKQCRVMIENKTDKPLNVKLPPAFAGVPVLAQNAGRGGRNRDSSSSNNSNQGIGGGMGMGGMGMGGMGGGMGMGFNIPPEKVADFKLTTVCLDHGKNEPRPAIPYEIKPIETFTDKVEVHELCRMLGTGQISQRAAQVAAWHLNNNMSWQQLAAKRYRHANGTSRPYFTPEELQNGMQISATAVKLAEQRKKAPSQSDSASLN